LHGAGHETTLIARGAHLAAMQRDGLVVESIDGAARVPVHAVGSPADAAIGAGDVVLLAMKSQDTEAALDALAAGAPRDVAVVCVQNGVANERAALRRFPHVYGVNVMFPTAFLEPGVVEAHASPIAGLLDIGRYPSGVDGTAEAVAAAFNASTFDSIPRPDIMRWKYNKLLMNLGNAIEALCGPAARGSDIAKRAYKEAIAVFTAAGIPFASNDEDRDRRGDRLRLVGVQSGHRGGGSTWQSLHRGSGIETDYLNGEVVLLGRLHGVPTPVNETLQHLMHTAARDGLAPGSLTEEDVLTHLPPFSRQ
jgi:2-dehydropantoate 2-reductase